LTRRNKGKAFYYRPKTKRESTFRSMLSELVNTFCGGSSEALLCHLLAGEKLSPEELLELQQVAQRQVDVSSESVQNGSSRSMKS
ncbi:MAG: BlaI/MecI/CopY family transcriptional regulator, partial [Thermoguttaceae bacterium]